MLNDEDDCTMTASQVVETYVMTFFLREGQVIRNSVDFSEMDTLLWNLSKDYKAKDCFGILETHAKCLRN